MKLQLSLSLAAFTLLPSYAGSAPAQLVFTEYSDTLLTATVGGSAVGVVENLGSDHWHWGIPVNGFQGVTLDPNGLLYWAEPEAATEFNHIQVALFVVQGQLYAGTELQSDVALSLSPGEVANNGAFANTLIISDGTGSQGFNIAFNDLSDRAAAPDSSATGSLLLISLGSLLPFAAKRRFTFLTR